MSSFVQTSIITNVHLRSMNMRKELHFMMHINSILASYTSSSFFLGITWVNPILVSILGRQLCCTVQCLKYFSFGIFIIRFYASFFFHGVFIHHEPPAIAFLYFPLFFQFINSFGCRGSNGWVAIFCQSLQQKLKESTLLKRKNEAILLVNSTFCIKL